MERCFPPGLHNHNAHRTVIKKGLSNFLFYFVVSGAKALNPSTKAFFSVNYQFITLYHCMKYIVRQNPNLVGFACNGHAEIQKKYSEFLNSSLLNRASNMSNPLKKWNFTKIDIKKCFDSIDVNLIKSYVTEKFEESLAADYVFTILRYQKIRFELDGKNLMRKQEYLTIKHKYHEKGFKYGTADFIDVLEFEFESRKSSRRAVSEHMLIVPERIHDKNVCHNKLENLLELCLNNVLIKIHNQLFIRSNGILHGSICSRLLCDIYLGNN
jgi:hypothetical protein